MLFALVHNNEIKVGPRLWTYSFFLDYIKENELDSSLLSRSQPTSAIITDDWKVLPVIDVSTSVINSLYEEPVGPFLTIFEDRIESVLLKKDRPLDFIKGDLRNIVAYNRYKFEVGKLEYTFPDGDKVELFMEREERSIYLQTLSVMNENDTIPFKFKNNKFRLGVTKSELNDIVLLGASHIRSAFQWESLKNVEIENASTIEEVKAIELRHPSQI